MNTTKREAFLQAINNWLFPPQPMPQIFLNLLTTGDDFLSPQKIKVSLQVARLEVALTSVNITENFANDFREWNLNYPSYAVWKEVFDLLNILVLFIGNDFPNLFYHQPKQVNNNLGNASIYSFYYRLILLICKVKAGKDIDTGGFRKPQKTIGEQSSGSRTEHFIEDAGERVKRSINEFFDSKDFKEVRDQLIKLLPSEDQPQPEVYIRYDDPMLAMLPLQLWDEFQARNIEPVFCSLKTSVKNKSFKKKRKPRILLILGDFVDIKNDNDKLNWQKFYPDAEIKALEMLNATGISNALWNERWDVLYFGGHSTTQERKGIIYLKDDVSITLGDFKKGLTEAARKGLQLAVFNSCISLGAAADLQSAGIPMVVATRHLMHNLIAPEFLEYFLDAYINADKSIKDAIWYARERLKTDNPYFPCANWLPVVFQIPTTPAIRKPSPLVSITTSFFVTCLVFFLHTQGIFQAAELSLYDHMMNSRQAEPLDPRIMIVQTTAEDRIRQEEKGNKVAGRDTTDDELMLDVIKKLDEAEAKVVGLTYWRDNAQRKSIASQELFDRIVSKRSPIIVTSCTSDPNGKDPEGFVVPPDEIPDKHPHIGFINMTSDSRNNDGTIRRLLLLQSVEGSKCSSLTSTSLSLRIVLDFLDKKISDKNVSSDGDYYALNVGDVKISSIYKGEGGYQVDPIGEVNSKMIALSKRLSILFKFKNHESDQIDIKAKQIFSVKEVMSGDYKEKFKDKIVIIGGVNVNSDSFRIYSGKHGTSQIDNLFIHAQAVDYLLRIFEGDNILKGFDNRILFLCYIFIDTFAFLYALFYILTSSINHKFYSVILLTVAFTLLIYNGHLYLLNEKSIWMPSIPIFAAMFLSTIILIPQLTKSNNLIH